MVPAASGLPWDHGQRNREQMHSGSSRGSTGEKLHPKDTRGSSWVVLGYLNLVGVPLAEDSVGIPKINTQPC